MKSFISIFLILLLLLAMSNVAFAKEESKEGLDLNMGERLLLGPYDANEPILGKMNGNEVSVAAATVVGTFPKGQKLYAYTASSNGSFLPNRGAYSEMFLTLKTEKVNLTLQDYYDYWDDRGANLYNTTLDGVDGYLRSFNDRNPTKNHRCSHFVSVKEGDTITFGPANPSQSFHAVGLKANGSVLDGNITSAKMLSKSSETLQHGLVFYTYKVPADMAYISVINYTPVQSMFVALKNQPALTPASYYAFLGADQNNPLYGKTALFVGDSISYGENDSVQNSIRLAWAGRVGLSNGLTYTNASVSGAALSTLRGGRILDQLNGKAGNTYDFVVIHGGVNDAWGNGNEGYIPAPVGKMTEGFTGNYDKTTYAGGLEQTFAAAKQHFPNAKLIYIMNFRAPECPRGTVSDMAAYFAEGAKICEKWDVFVCDLYSRYTFDDSNLLDDRMIHPNQYGYDILYPSIAAAMKASVQAVDTDQKIQKIKRIELSCIPAVEEARTAYDAMAKEVQEYVTLYRVLENAERALKNSLLGDVDMNCRLGIGDVVTLLRYSGGYMEKNNLNYYVGDLNGDQIIDTGDALAVLHAI